MKDTKSVLELNKFIDKTAGQLRAFRAAAWPILFLTTLSCSNPPLPAVCTDGECTAYIAPVKQTGDYYFDINEDDPKPQYFTVEVHASKVDPYWYYGDIGKISVKWSGNLQYLMYHRGGFDIINSADRETYGHFNEATTIITQLIGVKPQHSGETLDLNVEVLWDAGDHSVVKTFSQKITLK